MHFQLSFMWSRATTNDRQRFCDVMRLHLWQTKTTCRHFCDSIYVVVFVVIGCHRGACIRDFSYLHFDDFTLSDARHWFLPGKIHRENVKMASKQNIKKKKCHSERTNMRTENRFQQKRSCARHWQRIFPLFMERHMHSLLICFACRRFGSIVSRTNLLSRCSDAIRKFLDTFLIFFFFYYTLAPKSFHSFTHLRSLGALHNFFCSIRWIFRRRSNHRRFSILFLIYWQSYLSVIICAWKNIFSFFSFSRSFDHFFLCFRFSFRDDFVVHFIAGNCHVSECRRKPKSK